MGGVYTSKMKIRVGNIVLGIKEKLELVVTMMDYLQHAKTKAISSRSGGITGL